MNPHNKMDNTDQVLVILSTMLVTSIAVIMIAAVFLVVWQCN